MNTSTKIVAGLKCRFVDALPDNESPQMLVILNHGFGASGDDLVDLAPSLIGSSQRIAANCLFVFPEAPVDLGPLGMPGGSVRENSPARRMRACRRISVREAVRGGMRAGMS